MNVSRVDAGNSIGQVLASSSFTKLLTRTKIFGTETPNRYNNLHILFICTYNVHITIKYFEPTYNVHIKFQFLADKYPNLIFRFCQNSLKPNSSKS